MRYLNKDELAKLLHVTVRTITSYMANGLLPQPRRLGRRLLWDEVALQRFMAESSLPADSRAVSPQLARTGPIAPRKRGRPRMIEGLHG